MKKVTMCCEDFEGLYNLSCFYLSNDKVTMMVEDERTDLLEVNIDFCPFCGQKIVVTDNGGKANV